MHTYTHKHNWHVFVLKNLCPCLYITVGLDLIWWAVQNPIFLPMSAEMNLLSPLHFHSRSTDLINENSLAYFHEEKLWFKVTGAGSSTEINTSLWLCCLAKQWTALLAPNLPRVCQEPREPLEMEENLRLSKGCLWMWAFLLAADHLMLKLCRSNFSLENSSPVVTEY